MRPRVKNVHLNLEIGHARNTVEARKLGYDHPPIPKPRKEGKASQIVLCAYSNCLESTVVVPPGANGIEVKNRLPLLTYVEFFSCTAWFVWRIPKMRATVASYF